MENGLRVNCMQDQLRLEYSLFVKKLGWGKLIPVKSVSNSGIIFCLWLVGVILWNYGFPTALPLYDVIMSVILYIVSKSLVKIFKEK